MPAEQESPESARWPTLALLVFGAAALVVLLWATRDATFMQDEWDFIQDRLDNDDEAFFTPHNNHLLAFPLLLYKIIWSTVGLDDYWVVRVLAFAVHLTCVGLLFEFARRRVQAVAALALCLPILLLGSAWEDLLIPFNMQWYISVAALIGILLLVERETLRAELAIGALLLLALASSSLGPPVAAGLVVVCLITRRWRLLGVAVLPIALYGLWFLVYNIGAENQPPTELTASPAYLLHTAAGSVGALLGLPLGIRQVADRQWLVAPVHILTVALFALLAFQIQRRRQALTPALALILTTLGTYWIVLTVTRGYTGYAYISRYLYVSCVLLVLLVAECLRGRRLTGRTVAALAGIAVISAGLNSAILLDQSWEQRRHAIILSAELAALESARVRVAPTFTPDEDKRRAVTIRAQAYFAATDRLGSSPAPSSDELARMPRFAQRAAEEVLIRAFGLEPQPSTAQVQRFLDAAGRASTKLRSERVLTGKVKAYGRCVAMLPEAAMPAVAIFEFPKSGLSFLGPSAGAVGVTVRGLGGLPLRIMPPSRPGETYIRAPSGASTRGLGVRVSSARPVVLC